MKSKLLIVSTLGRQFYLFEEANIQALRGLGVEIHGLANLKEEDADRLKETRINLHHAEFSRSPLSPRNLVAFWQTLRLLRSERFDALHVHSPVAGVLSRVAAFICRVPKVIYTAHGFHFFDGGPVASWLKFYPIERMLAKITDLILVMNDEDLQRANRMGYPQVVEIPGVGVAVHRFERDPAGGRAIRDELAIAPTAFVTLSVGELIPRKDHATTIRGFAMASTRGDRHLVICGRGSQEAELKELSMELGVGSRVHFLGFRRDIQQVCSAADLFVSSSTQEGLPVSCIEAMAAALPLLLSRIRGHIDLVADGANGACFAPRDATALATCIETMAEDRLGLDAMGGESFRKSVRYGRDSVATFMEQTYSELLDLKG